MIWRELAILMAAMLGFGAAITGYLVVFHGAVLLKDVFSSGFAAIIGLYAGRYLERRLAHGRA